MSNTQVPTTLSATAPAFDPFASLKAEVAFKQAKLTDLKASCQRSIRLALSEESCSDSIEEYLATKQATKYQDHLISSQQFIIEEHEKKVQQFEEWVEIERILNIGREHFRAEVESERKDMAVGVKIKLAEGIGRRV